MTNTRRILGACLTVVLATLPIRSAAGQSDSSAVRAATPDSTSNQSLAVMDSAFARARRLVMSGQTVAGRQIGDSILAATPSGTPAYGNALYGTAMLAPTAAAAQLDYQRIIVEYPLSPHAGDALLQLAQLERSQGNRAGAIGHLQRYLRENPMSAERGRTGLWLAQLMFEQNDDLRACGVLDTARAATSSSNIELLNQMNFYSARCAAATANAAADSAARADSMRAAQRAAHEDSVKRSEARARSARLERERARRTTRATATEGRYSIQLGAYATRAQADKLVRTLYNRGIKARIEGDRKPFRVRAGYYRTRADADQALARFKRLGYAGFVTTTDGH
jgi:cell division septation protein DedD